MLPSWDLAVDLMSYLANGTGQALVEVPVTLTMEPADDLAIRCSAAFTPPPGRAGSSRRRPANEFAPTADEGLRPVCTRFAR